MQALTATEAKQYFQRIGVDMPTETNATTLREVVTAHIQSIPFENFDLMLGRGTDLNPDAVFKKMVLNKRGGCCFELNGLLRRALVYVGYTVEPLLGRVHWRGDPGPRTHMLLQVTTEGEDWLVDVGFGGPGLLEPIPFRCDEVFNQRDLQFRVIKDPGYHFILQAMYEGQWKNIYSFDLTVVNQIDMDMANFFVTHYQGSFFTVSRIATMPTKKGRNTLLNYKVTQKEGGEDMVTELKDDNSYLKALRKYFGIELNADYEDLKKTAL